MISPVLFLIFKRAETTKKVFERIKEAKPPKLYIAADGPRRDRPEEVAKCVETRKIVENIDWPCEVYRLYREENLGCGKGVSSALDWFFDNEEQGIIIEDDILPNIDFFKYCDEMLELYKNDERIQLITGRNAFFEEYKSNYSYYLSILFHIWGWASWRRVWKTYHFETSELSMDVFKERLLNRGGSPKMHKYWIDVFKMMQNNPIDTWDYQLYFNEVFFNRYSIVPYINMTENIGFNSIDAAHTILDNSKEANHRAQSPYPLSHPSVVSLDMGADNVFAMNFGFVKLTLCERIIRKLKKVFRKKN